MNKHSRILALAAAAAIIGTVACQPKLSEQAKAAQEAASTADARVAALEKELAEVRKASEQGEADTKKLGEDHAKALEKLVADAKKKAAATRQEATQLAKEPAKAAPAPVVVEVPAGTKLEIALAKGLDTDTVKAGDSWNGTLAEAVVVGGKTVWPAGTSVSGVVTQSTPAGALSSGKGALGIRLTQVGRADVDAGSFVVTAGAKGERNAKYIGGGAAIGALAGILSDKDNRRDHALAGAALGAIAGTAVAAGTADKVVRIPADKPVSFTLTSPEKVTLK